MNASVEGNQSEWHSVYVYVADDIYGAAFDWTVSRLASPIVQDLQTVGRPVEMFFVRYGAEGGWHLRLRLRDRSPDASGALQPLVEERLQKFRRAGACILDYQWVEYEPEVDRYGGLSCIQAAESFFCASSVAVASILDDLADRPRSARLGKGIILGLTLLSACSSDRKQVAKCLGSYGLRNLLGPLPSDEHAGAIEDCNRFCDENVSRIDTLVAEVWRRLVHLEPISPAVDGYRLASRDYITSIATARGESSDDDVRSRLVHPAFRSPVLSQLHMTWNRLGISKREEAYISMLISTCLDHQNA